MSYDIENQTDITNQNWNKYIIGQVKEKTEIRKKIVNYNNKTNINREHTCIISIHLELDESIP